MNNQTVKRKSKFFEAYLIEYKTFYLRHDVKSNVNCYATVQDMHKLTDP